MLTLDDYTVQLQFDDSKVTKGINALEKKFAKLGKSFKMQSSVGGGSRRGAKASTGGFSAGSRLQQEFSIDKSRRQAEAAKTRSSGLGGDAAAVNARNLTKQIERLSKAEAKLATITDKNSKEFIEFSRDLRRTKLEVQALDTVSKRLTRDLTAQQFAVNRLSMSLKNMASSWVSVFALLAGANAVKRMATEFQNIGIAAMSASGSGKQAAEDLAFVSVVAEDLGLRLKDTSSSFAQFNSAALSGGVSAADSRSVFTNLSTSIASSGLSADAARLSFLGFRQMMSGSVIQAQDMNQVVDQMPQFSGAAVKALKEMGFETDSWRKTIATGTVSAQEFVKITSRLLRKQAEDSGAAAAARQSITAEENRALASFEKAVNNMTKAGLGEFLAETFSGIRLVIEALSPALVALGYAFKVLGDAVALPFRVLDELAQLIGFGEGQGIVWGIRLLSAAILTRLVPSLLALLPKMISIGTAFLFGSKGLLSYAVGASTAAKANFTLAASMRALLRAAGVGLAIEAASIGLDFLTDQGMFADAKSNSTPKGKASSDNSTNIASLTIQAGEGADGTEIARTFMEEMGAVNRSQMLVS